MPKNDCGVRVATHKRLDGPFYIQPRHPIPTEGALLQNISFNNLLSKSRMPSSTGSGAMCALDKAPGPKRKYCHNAPDLDGGIIN